MLGNTRSGKIMPIISLLLLLEVVAAAAFVIQESRFRSTARFVKLGFLSFDLDDTLFPTNRVVEESNDLMIDHMKKLGYASTVDDFLEMTRSIRLALEAPVTYTDLRKLAIRGEMERTNLNIIADDIVDEIFDVWLDARQELANDYLFDGAVECLKEIKFKHPDVCIAAITNGRGDPKAMPRLSPWFDFTVSGEEEQVFPNRKPHVGIYNIALERYRKERENGSEHLWIHVGDCLANDVGASASAGARAVWFCPTETDVATATARLTSDAKPAWSTATQADLKERATQAGKARRKVSTRIRKLSELVGAIDELLEATSPTNGIN